MMKRTVRLALVLAHAFCGAAAPNAEAKEWPGFSRGMGIGGWLYYEIVKGLQ